MQRSGTPWFGSPAACLAVALATGIWWSDRHGDVRVTFVVLVLSLAAAVRLLLANRRSPPLTLAPVSRFAIALLLFACFGSIRFQSTHRPAADPLPEVLHFEGTVTEAVTTSSGRRRVVVEASTGARLTRLLAYLPDGQALPPSGSRVAATARPLPFPRPRNPGDFDYGRYLERRGIEAVVRIEDPPRIVGAVGPLDLAVTAVQHFVESVLERDVPSQASRTVLRALILGDRSGIDPQVTEAFVLSGLVHLLAVSGLHVMLVGMLFYRLSGPTLARLGLRWRAVEPIRTAITLGVLATYALVTGRPASVVRAVTMTAALLTGPLLRRRSISINSLGVAAILILCLQPYSLFEPGFQLSVAAVAGIIVLVPPMQDWMRAHLGERFARSSVAAGVLVSCAATLSTLPVLLTHFGRASLAGILLNIPGIPITAAALCSALLCLLTAAVPVASSAFGAASDTCIRLLVYIASTGSSALGFLSINTAARPVGWILLLAMIAAAGSLHRPDRIARIAAATLVLCAGLRLRDHATERHLDVLFFDVGQGDAAVLQTPAGNSLLIDTGPAHDRFNAGARIVLPYLRHVGIDQLDAVVLTHAHADHIGGTLAVLRQIPVERLIVSAASSSTEAMRPIHRVADSLDIPVKGVRKGDSLYVDPDLRVYVLAPEDLANTLSNENDRSLVLNVRYGSSTLLLMGDAERITEIDLVSSLRPLLSASVVKVAHHGSSTSSRPELVRAVSEKGAASWAVVSVAARNRYRHPSPSVMQRWSDAGLKVVTTASEGGILLTTDGSRVRRKVWRRGLSTD